MKKLFTKEEYFFIFITYIFSWLIWIPLLLNKQFNLNIFTVPFQFYLASFGPLIGAILTKAIFGKKNELKNWFKRVLSFSFNKKWLVIALMLPIIYFAIGYIAQYIFTGSLLDISKIGLTSKLPNFNALQVLLILIFTFGIGEEMGWRGYLFPNITKRYNKITASYLVTLIWALWHLPAFFFNPIYMEMGLGIIGWLISLTFGSVLLGYFCEKSNYSIVPVLLWHAGFDLITASDIGSDYLAPVVSALVIIQGIFIIKYIWRKKLINNEIINKR
jgi:membrane protease YdiL (CAAX protease family)